jgi:spermidine synthase
VVKVARDARLFSYLAECAPDARIVVGDARLRLAEDQPPFDLVVLDAFSSDAIPLHLLTREAFALYRQRTTEGGLIALHISNRHLDLAPAVAALARETGFAALIQAAKPPEGGPRYLYRTVWVAMGSEAALAPLRARGDWQALTAPLGLRAWTDDHSDLISVVRAKW